MSWRHPLVESDIEEALKLVVGISSEDDLESVEGEECNVETLRRIQEVTLLLTMILYQVVPAFRNIQQKGKRYRNLALKMNVKWRNHLKVIMMTGRRQTGLTGQMLKYLMRKCCALNIF